MIDKKGAGWTRERKKREDAKEEIGNRNRA